jgi:ABC-type transport system involved in cytochrome c biogenesis permease subunit
MATSDLAPSRGLLQPADSRSQLSVAQFSLDQLFSALASLRLTVVLFSLSIFLVFVGTLAQKDQDVWRVVNNTYFRVWIAHVDLQVFERLVQLFLKGVDWKLHGWVPFPGGKTLGLALLINLAAAHAMRFKVAASGRRLIIGVATIAAGLLVTYLVISSGTNQGLESELSGAFCDMFWHCFRGLLVLLTASGAYLLAFWNAPAKHKLIEWRVLLVVDVLFAILTAWLLTHPDARLDNSSIRILWQLAKGSASAIVLLVGCILVFRKRAGIVLLHGGIALIMLTELFTAVAAEESQMIIGEGETANYSSDIRTSELAVVDHSPVDQDRVTVVPAELLVANVGEAEPIDHPDLPFTIRVHRWLKNSTLHTPTAGESNAATAGFGTLQIAGAARPATGVGQDAGKVDTAAAYVELVTKKSGQSLGTYLVSQEFADQPVEVDGHNYDVALRYKRIYHPFTVTLKDFRFDRYAGTNTAKNYSSLVVFKDPQHHIEREVPIWMNNPLRYAGITFYQSSFDKRTERSTVLQVVKNPSWMTPYVGCMLVGVGMLAHFGLMLFRYLRRRAEDVQRFDATAFSDQVVDRERKHTHRGHVTTTGTATNRWTTVANWLPAIVLIVFVSYIAGKARLPQTSLGEMQLYEFAKLPVVYEGRVKPYDTLARNSLQILSGRQEVGVLNTRGKVESHLSAIRWLLDAISGANGAGDHRVFRVENLDLLDALGLEHRPLFWRYSLNEITNKAVNLRNQPNVRTELDRQRLLAEATPEKDRSLFQNKVLELGRKYDFYTVLVVAFRSPPQNADPQTVIATLQELLSGNPPFAVPPTTEAGEWAPYYQASLELQYHGQLQRPTNSATVELGSLLQAYARGDIATFNKHLMDYRALLVKYEQSLVENAKQLQSAGVANSEVYSQAKSNFEVFFNQFSPFYYACVLYVVAFVVGVLSWLGWTQPLRRASVWLLWFTFALHTFALVSRIYISGRPPVTNLYSTAIFIGWAAVLLSLIVESIQKLGLASIVASVIGFITLFLAYNLSLDGDTFIVLQAVLDTQFWLATHVITINLGYAATYAAGAWGIVYILCAQVFPVINEDARKKVLRTLYGTLCFAIFFSFVGTVLGGLWADDSWGRFWGWDPKENGALMIVLWNALVLHARWGGLVQGRGLATLAIGGNIITTWSYFGVNEYGVGLHAYGASTSSTAMWLLTFAASQLALIGLGLMPLRRFESLASSRSNVAS